VISSNDDMCWSPSVVCVSLYVGGLLRGSCVAIVGFIFFFADFTLQ
jgi:hypothetical protein